MAEVARVAEYQADDLVSPKKATEIIRPKLGITWIRKLVDDFTLRAVYTPGGQRQIEVGSIWEYNAVMKSRPGPEREAALEQLRLRNGGNPRPTADDKKP